MPGIVHTDKIAEDLEHAGDLIDENQIGLALREIRKISDGIQSIWQQTENSPNLHKYRPRYYTEFEDIQEKQTAQETGIITGKKIDLNAILKDIEQIYRHLDQNKTNHAQTLLVETCNTLEKKTTDKYNDPGKIGDLILQARSELRKQSQTIASKKFVAQMIHTTDAFKLTEKYIDQAYEHGKEEEQNKKTNAKKKVFLHA